MIEERRSRIAIDAMGGDHAPAAVVDGAVQAARVLPADILLVGQEDRIQRELETLKPVPANLSIHHASEVIGMGEPPATSVRRKRDSSICRMVELAKSGQADAIVSAGNTGAMVCAASLGLGLLPGIDRPGIAVVIPSLAGPTLVIDVGANVDSKPEHLAQYGVMGSVYMQHVLEKINPKVGLLNVGEEESKGTDFIRQAFKLLESSALNFIGNVEGRDIYTGRCDVIVCDGFVGNVVLKVSESMTFALTDLLRHELKRTLLNKLAAAMLIPAFRRMRSQMDYTEYGGAPLLGVRGACMIGHGSSSAKAVTNAIRAASSFVTHDVNQHIIAAAVGGQPPQERTA
ncbi:MAG: phosphate--acyl-ACP acyltransferase [Candidatus Omnitrophica bacterium CG11_big_fil_rev_8_21_14_0_20_64_10]|nr:MAG: phosphate--acyl-ACP acyltransferase [Candidatus Omnitrophica bacterium CG11_big_fil_rev_8_21_14_0_20_64_10]